MNFATDEDYSYLHSRSQALVMGFNANANRQSSFSSIVSCKNLTLILKVLSKRLLPIFIQRVDLKLGRGWTRLHICALSILGEFLPLKPVLGPQSLPRKRDFSFKKGGGPHQHFPPSTNLVSSGGNTKGTWWDTLLVCRGRRAFGQKLLGKPVGLKNSGAHSLDRNPCNMLL